MKSIPKLIRRFVGIMMTSVILLIVINIIFYISIFWKYATHDSAWDIADKAAKSIHLTDNGYALSDEIVGELKERNVWGILIDDNTREVIWHTEKLPNNIPKQYTLSDISDLSRGYVEGYPTFTGKTESGLLVLGYPKDSYWKLLHASWNYDFIANLPKYVFFALCVNIFLMFIIYVITNSRLLRSIKPITNGIKDLSSGEPVHIEEKGVLSELATNINKTSKILQDKTEKLNKKETARANWIAGVSHDIRTPLSMIMGYASQLENAQGITEEERKKASVIVKQSNRIKSLINNLNLASKLEYNMQPLMMKQENVVAIIRQVVVDFINMEIDEKFSFEWDTDENLLVCDINLDKDLLKRAVINLIQNSINHNDNGCTIYVSVYEDNNDFIICVEDSGIGVSDEQIVKLNKTPHYMVCDNNTTEQRHGLGLLIVKQVISNHNGKVLIDHSKYGGFKTLLIIPKSTCINSK
ncbi:MAG: HAMP domain-containing sensor histidine kinase [Anaerorhabdus sp.]|uniref:sensor histidine kinase n=1 Tax=Anaerorhabdus sp. TaxID=1872524 RepID=UPI002FC5BEAD